MRPYRLEQDFDVSGGAVVARFMGDGAADFQHLEALEGETGVMSFGIGEAGDAVEDRLVQGLAGGGDLDDVLMQMVFHGIPRCLSATVKSR